MKAPKKVTKNSHGSAALTLEELAEYPFHCPNCSVTFDNARRTFCSNLCQSEAKCVRRMRRCIADGRYDDPTVKDGLTVKDGIRIQMAFILEGGYAREEPSESVRRSLIERAGGRCEMLCGRPGTDAHHIQGNSNELANLQWLCKTCHNPKILDKLTKLTEASDPKKLAKWEGLLERVFAIDPQLLCDDDERWDRKELMRKRRMATGQIDLFG